MNSLQLTNSTVINRHLALQFSNSVEVFLAFDYLRRACPCAACQGEPDALGRVYRPKLTYHDKAFDLQKIELIGGYALQLFWADGHSTGIYSFQYLINLESMLSTQSDDVLN
jgi:DUF971 family protein